MNRFPASRKTRQRLPLEISIPDLLSPQGTPVSFNVTRPIAFSRVNDAAWITDLGLSEVIEGFGAGRLYTPAIRAILSTPLTDPATIHYRQAILKDFADHPALIERVEALLPRLADLRQGHVQLGNHQRAMLLETVDRLAELDLYLTTIQSLQQAFRAAQPRSQGMQSLQQGLDQALSSEAFQALTAELPTLRAPLNKLSSMTIGINLDADLHPIAAVLLALNEKHYPENSALLERLIGLRTDLTSETGLAPLHAAPADPNQRMLSSLFQDMERLVHQIAIPIARELERYVRASSTPLARLEEQLAFYVYAARLLNRLRSAGVPVCFPEPAPAVRRVAQIEGLVNAGLAVRGERNLVESDAHLDDQGRLAILTGPNSGGKTTYLQAVGLAQALFQAGMFITARTAQLSPVDSILTHFPALETRQQGRLSEESARLREIFLTATDQSLVLLNESLASTTPSESLYLATETLSALRWIGVRAIFATHLIELVDQIPVLEARLNREDCHFISLVAGVYTGEGGRILPTYRIAPGVPLKSGYAQEIARQHGISLEQIQQARQEKPQL
jgi:DNA mismatch repair ATPase MutS